MQLNFPCFLIIEWTREGTRGGGEVSNERKSVAVQQGLCKIYWVLFFSVVECLFTGEVPK